MPTGSFRHRLHHLAVLGVGVDRLGSRDVLVYNRGVADYRRKAANREDVGGRASSNTSGELMYFKLVGNSLDTLGKVMKVIIVVVVRGFYLVFVV